MPPATETGPARARLRLTGRVQAVGFRLFARRTAQSMGLAGFARNLIDGSMEIEVEGSRPDVMQFVGAVRHGPSGARVAELTMEWIDPHAEREFRIV